MNENVYMHAISYYDVDNQILTLLDIARSGAILSLRNQGKTESYSFAGLDYISLCDYSKRFMTPQLSDVYNGYNAFVRYCVSLAFDKNKIDAVVPEYVEIIGNSIENTELMAAMGNAEKRYSDFMDEVQVKDQVSLEHLEYMTFPTRKYLNMILAFTKQAKYDALMRKVDDIKTVMNYFNYDSDIYDIDTKIKMDSEGIRKLVYKK